MLQIYFPSCTLTKGYSLELQKCYFLYVHKYICSKVQILLYFAGYALGIWICGCSLFYKRELWASKSAGSHSSKSLKISGCKRWCPKDLRVRAPAAPVLTHSLLCRTKASLWYLTVTSVIFSMRKSTLTFILLEFRLFCVRNSELTFLVARFQNWMLRSVFVYKLVDFRLANGKQEKSKWQNSVKSQTVEERKVNWDWGSEFRFIFWQNDNLIKEMVSVLVHNKKNFEPSFFRRIHLYNNVLT